MGCVVLLTGNTGGAVNEDENHAAEGPGDAEKADAVARAGLVLVADDGGDSDVEEEESGDELGDEGPVEGPALELVGVEERRRRWVDVVLAVVVGLRLLADFFGHCFNTGKVGREESRVSSGSGSGSGFGVGKMRE